MTSKGIDYGMGVQNINHESGIRYGVIPVNDVLQAWADSAEPEYSDETEQMCGECGQMQAGTVGQTVECSCGYNFDLELSDFAEPLAYSLNDGEYVASQNGDDTDIFIISSPYFTYAQFCSPCAPGACHLRNPLDVGELTQDNMPRDMAFADNKCYCFGHDWFDDGIAPYPVFSVATGKRVMSEDK
jgi:hypothetical protein